MDIVDLSNKVIDHVIQIDKNLEEILKDNQDIIDYKTEENIMVSKMYISDIIHLLHNIIKQTKDI